MVSIGGLQMTNKRRQTRIKGLSDASVEKLGGMKLYELLADATVGCCSLETIDIPPILISGVVTMHCWENYNVKSMRTSRTLSAE